MKTKFKILIFVLALSVGTGATFYTSNLSAALPPVATTIINGQSITLANSNDLEVQFEVLSGEATGWKTGYVSIISLVGSGVQVGNKAITVQQSWEADSHVPISFRNGVHNIHIKGNNGDVVAITW